MCILKILYNIKDSCCGIEIVLFLKSSFRLWVYWDWRLRELNGKIGIFLSMLIVLRVKYSLCSQYFYLMHLMCMGKVADIENING